MLPCTACRVLLPRSSSDSLRPPPPAGSRRPLHGRLSYRVSTLRLTVVAAQPEDAVAGCIPEEDKAPVREYIIDLMLTTEPLVRAQLSAAVACISKIDFPSHWPGLLPGLAKHAGSSDPSVIIGVLETAAAVFERFDGAYECDEVNIALKAALDGFCEPLHAIFGTLSAAMGPALSGGASSLPQLKLVLTAFDLAGQCFHHLCYPVLADEMNDRLSVSIPALMNLLK